jgi:hypothetical protein
MKKRTQMPNSARSVWPTPKSRQLTFPVQSIAWWW